MIVESVPKQLCIDLLKRLRFGRLACEHAGQPYVTPFYFAFHDDALYSFSTVGQKIEWMRRNPLVCVEADEITSPQKWVSVIAFGRFEELPADADHEYERRLAHSLLQERPIWWEPGYAKTVTGGELRSLDIVYFRIHLRQVTGHQAKP